ncbi:MAG: hypothetical protein SPL13_01670 [Clostridia bacterium]|nr:hypothetical protein [Clostridia bacterium]
MKKSKNKSENTALSVVKNVGETNETGVAVYQPSSEDVFDDISVFSALFNETPEQIKNGIRVFELRRFAGTLGQITVRYEIREKEILRIMKKSLSLGVGEILTSPVYLSGYRKVVNKTEMDGQKVCAVIDFPLGESTLKAKVADVKACEKFGVDGYTVVMPSVFVKNPNEFKKQLKKIKGLTDKNVGVAFSTTELDADDVKSVFRAAEKVGAEAVTLLFGDQTEQEILSTAKAIKENKGKIEVRILGNVRSAEAVAAVKKLGADKVFTPYAVDIAEDLLKRFNIKGIKLN